MQVAPVVSDDPAGATAGLARSRRADAPATVMAAPASTPRRVVIGVDTGEDRVRR